MKKFLRRLMKAHINDKLAVAPAAREMAYFSYRGYALAININNSNIDEVFEIAKTAFKNTMEREGIIDDRSQRKDGAGEEVRAENGDEQTSESVAGDTAAGEVSSVLPESKESDVR